MNFLLDNDNFKESQSNTDIIQIIFKNDISMINKMMIFHTLSAKDYEVAVESLELEEIIGQGQFGDVYRGVFKSPVSKISTNVAKHCKSNFLSCLYTSNHTHELRKPERFAEL